MNEKSIRSPILWLCASDSMDPRLSILITLVVSIEGLLSYSLGFLFILGCTSTLLVISSHKSSPRKAMASVLGIVGFFFLFYLVGIISLQEVTLAILRLGSLNLVFYWFFSSINPVKLTQALVWFKMPYLWAWVISGAVRFVDLFSMETRELYHIQVLRTVPLDGTLVQRIKAMPTLLVPLIVRTHLRSQQLAEAMFIRGWSPQGRKTFLSNTRFLKRCNLFWILLAAILVSIPAI